MTDSNKKHLRKARRLYDYAEWIIGNGRYAVLAHCRVLTITLWETLAEAQIAKNRIDETACGGECNGNHEIVDLEKPK